MVLLLLRAYCFPADTTYIISSVAKGRRATFYVKHWELSTEQDRILELMTYL